MFEVIPHQTTRQEIIEFAESSSAYNGTDIHRDGWIHPGSYCPNGCTWRLKNYGSREIWERVEERFERTHTVKLVVGALSIEIQQFKVYVDGYICVTRQTDNAPENSVLVWLEPGEHRIIAREYEVKKVDRLESNAIDFTTVNGEEVEFQLALNGENLYLIKC